MAAVDIGAGHGAQIAVFNENGVCLCKGELGRDRYGKTAKQFVDILIASVKESLECHGFSFAQIAVMCIGMPGLMDTTRQIVSCVNLAFLKGANLGHLIQEELGIPVLIKNDGDCGVVAEWDFHQHELLYWVLGGGWGGSWIGRDGCIRFSSNPWDGCDQSIHFTNEPGFATRLPRNLVADLFRSHRACLDRFFEMSAFENDNGRNYMNDPDDTDMFRAELFVSGPGMWRLLHSVITEKEWKSFSETQKTKLMHPHTAGPELFKMGKAGNRTALLTFALLGSFLGHAGSMIIEKAILDGAAPKISIYIGGGLAKAFDLFAPAAEDVLRQKECGVNLLKSHYLESDVNANLIGACILMKRFLESKGKSVASNYS